MKKFLALLLALLMVAGTLSLAACGGDKPDDGKEDPVVDPVDPGKDPGTDPVDPGTDPAEPGTDPVDPGTDPVQPDKKYLDDMDEQMDFGGEVIRFLVDYEDGESRFTLIADEDNYNMGDAIEFGIYTRQHSLQDRMNVVMEMVADSDAGVRTKIMADSTGGTNDYDIITPEMKQHAALALQGYILNLARLPHIDLTKDYWNEVYSKQWGYKGTQYWATGDACGSFLRQSIFIAVNDELFTTYNPDVDLFALVEAGEWTTEKCLELTSGCYVDATGDGRSDDDTYGLRFANDWRSGILLKSAGYAPTVEGKTKWSVRLGGEDNLKVLDAINKMTYENNGATVANSLDFTAGTTMMMTQIFQNLEDDSFRSLSYDFSIIPCPKLTVEDEYRSHTFTAPGILGCVNTLPSEKYDMIGSIIECYASMGRQFVTEGYYEIALRTKYARNEGSYRALEIVRRGIWTDFGLAWCGGLNQIDIFITDVFLSRANLISAAESAEPTFQKLLDGIYVSFKKQADAEKAAGY